MGESPPSPVALASDDTVEGWRVRVRALRGAKPDDARAAADALVALDDPAPVQGDAAQPALATPPHRAIDILRAVWRDADPQTRVTLMRAFVWRGIPPPDYAPHPRALDALELGFNDRIPPVRQAAAHLARVVAFQDLAPMPAAFAAWRAGHAGAPIERVIADALSACVRRGLDAARAEDAHAALPALALELGVLADGAPALRWSVGVRVAALGAGLEEVLAGGLRPPRVGDAPMLALRVAHALPPSEEFQRATILPLLGEGEPLPVRVAAAGVFSFPHQREVAEEALDAALRSCLRSEEAMIELAPALAEAIADTRAQRCVPTLIAVMEADPVPMTYRRLGMALHRLAPHVLLHCTFGGEAPPEPLAADTTPASWRRWWESLQPNPLFGPREIPLLRREFVPSGLREGDGPPAR